MYFKIGGSFTEGQIEGHRSYRPERWALVSPAAMILRRVFSDLVDLQGIEVRIKIAQSSDRGILGNVHDIKMVGNIYISKKEKLA